MAWAPPYATAEEMKSYNAAYANVADAELASHIEAASRVIDEHCGRQFGQVEAAETRTYPARWDVYRNRWVLDIDDLDDDTGLTVTVGATSVAEWTLEAPNAVLEGLVWTRLVLPRDAMSCASDVAVGGVKWGWSGMPITVGQACKLQTSRFIKRGDAPFGIAGSPDSGSEMRLLARADPDVAVMLRRYVRLRKGY